MQTILHQSIFNLNRINLINLKTNLVSQKSIIIVSGSLQADFLRVEANGAFQLYFLQIWTPYQASSS